MPRPAESALASVFDDLVGEFGDCCRAAGEVQRTLRVGDRVLRLTFAGDALAAALLPALAPRLAPSAPPDVDVSLWEERTSGPTARTVPWIDSDLGPRGFLGTERDSLLAVHEMGSGAVTVVDQERRMVLYRVPSAHALPWWERAAPLRPALFWALEAPDRGLVHAGVVGDPDRGGVLLAGAGGSGKTTVALAALAAGSHYVGDDYVLLSAAPTPTAWNLFGTAKLDDGHLARFPVLAAGARRSASPEPDEKSVLDVFAARPAAVADQLPVRAVVVPRIRGGRARLRPISGGDALLALAPSTVFQMPFDRGRIVALLSAVARGVPCFGLDVGDRPEELAGAVDDVLGHVAARA